MAVGALGLVACAAVRSGAGGGASDGGVTSPAEASAPSGPKCGATVTRIVDLSALAADVGAFGLYGVRLAVDATSIYFGYDHALMSVPIRGGQVVTRALLPEDPDELIVTSTNIVFPVRTGTGFDEAIFSVPIAGGSLTTLATVAPAANGALGFGADDRNVYFVDAQGTKRVAPDGGAVRVINDQVTSATAAGSIAVVGSDLVVPCCKSDLAQSTVGDVLSVPLDGGAPTTLATGQPNAWPLACGSDICWWTGETPFGEVGTSGPGAIARLAPDGGLMTLPNAPYFPWSFLFDGTDFFETVGCDVCDGTLLRIPASGAPVVAMGAGTFAAVDDECVYFSNPGGIYSVAKSYGDSAMDGGADGDAVPAGSVPCSQTLGPVDAGVPDVGPTRWCTPPSGCEPYAGGWACCFYGALGTTTCDLVGGSDAAGDAGEED